MSESIKLKYSVVIEASQEEVFEFVANPLNDHLWRSEVNRIESSGEISAVGTEFLENAWIGIQKNFITITRLVEYKAPDRALFITVDRNPYFLKSDRIFSSLKDGKTLFTYKVDFDKKMVPKTFGINVRPSIVKKLYGILMKKYLRKLKSILDS